MARRRTYTDAQLMTAVAASTSWRGVLRALGLNATSASAIRSLRQRADAIGADYGHFSSPRSLDEDSLRAAITAAARWSEVTDALGLESPAAIASMRGRAARFGIDVSHLDVPPALKPVADFQPLRTHLARAGSLLAASFLTLSGADVAWPLEPCRYDLVVTSAAGVRRVQVKTTTVRAGATWKAFLSTSRRGRRTYTPDEIDEFFVIDGDLGMYLIPFSVVGGLHAIHLGAYEKYRLAPLAVPLAWVSVSHPEPDEIRADIGEETVPGSDGTASVSPLGRARAR